MHSAPVLAIPPFPGAKPPRFAERRAHGENRPCDENLLEALAHYRVGGCYWGRQRQLPSAPYELDGTGGVAADTVAWHATDDPWHVLSQAAYARLTEDDPRAILAIAAGVPLVLQCADGTLRDAQAHDARRWTKALLEDWRFTSPFDGSELAALEAIRLCGFWRELIDANRPIGSVMGIAYWKKPTVTPLLWAGDKVPYNRAPDSLDPGTSVAVWRSRLTRAKARHLEGHAGTVCEIEDGFIRSAGLGADCVPPLSIIVDALGPHFAPGAPSELERLLCQGVFAPDILERARSLRRAIVSGGLSKYETGANAALPRPAGERRHVLVPGQVEDDRAVTSGGALPSNLALLRRAREVAGPAAHLIYKPHPDVLAGHRRGRIPDSEMAKFADHVEMQSPMPALIAMVDELHVNSSLAGFEGLLRGKPVTVHGVPFYAGWGLTTDLGPVPERRSARRTLDELVAAALLVYPRYLDPETGLPCPAEVVVERLTRGVRPKPDLRQSAIVTGRRLQGRLRAGLARLSR